ncbi:DUF4158 domain-containing protein [Streptomyces sp. WAC 06783]|uniref:DUF4158 domain-containing protein n=1 Tax=Streptomyces sp. WAC 06783 TaxID=2203211 RepID=UPI0021AE29FB|nr:DUF4158 domain-containing protein [Streptomyces sp. WAC 06783]
MIKGSEMGSQEVFLDEPTDIPVEVADYLAEQLGIEDASVLKAYGERESTRLDHVRELRRREYREFAEVDPGTRPQPGSLAVHGSSGSRAGSVRLVPAYPSAHVRSACRWSCHPS